MNQGWWLWSTGLLRKPPPSGGGGGGAADAGELCPLQVSFGQCGAQGKINKNPRIMKT